MSKTTDACIVYFAKENCVEAVPECWFNSRENLCAWPVQTKNIKKIIESYQKPNKNDFVYFSARKLGNKTYGSLVEARAKLPKATFMSDLSSTEEDSNISKKRSLSKSSTTKTMQKKRLTNTCPPPNYLDFKKNKDHEQSGMSINNNIKSSTFPDILSYDSNADDTDVEHHVNAPQNSSTFDEDIYEIPPTPNEKVENVVCSPRISNWSVEIVNNFPAVELAAKNDDVSSVKRVLQYSEKKTLLPERVTSNDTSHNNIDTFKSRQDFEKYIFTTLTHLKYDVSTMMNVINVTLRNTETLMDTFSRTSSAHVTPLVGDDDIDIDTIFPIYNDEQLANVENKIIQDQKFRKTLISKLSLIGVATDLGHSVRRIVSRMFADEFLIKYSLIGFKKKRPFSQLMLYRVLIDSLRVHTKYKTATEREIDLPLGVWLAHARFRCNKQETK